MSRSIRNTVILAALETTAGVDALPTGAANALLISDMSITPLDAQNIARNNIKGAFGADGELVGPASKKISFTIELAGSGTAATAPALGVLLLGCAMAEGLLSTPARVEYSPASTGLKTLTFYYYDDGVVHKLVGAMGDCTLTAKVGERPQLKFDFTGLDGGDVVGTPTGVTYAQWKTPVAMTKANVVDITLGATYGAGAIAGGQVVPSTGLEIKFGNSVNFTPLLSSETVDITNREMTGTVEMDLTAAQEVANMALVKANTLQSLALTIGLSTGNKLIIHVPTMQLTSPKKVDLNGKRLIGYDFRCIPVNGNDELRLAFV